MKYQTLAVALVIGVLLLVGVASAQTAATAGMDNNLLNSLFDSLFGKNRSTSVGLIKSNDDFGAPNLQADNAISGPTVSAGQVNTKYLCVGGGDKACTDDGVFQGTWCGFNALTVGPVPGIFIPHGFPCKGVQPPNCPPNYSVAIVSGYPNFISTCVKG